MQKVRKMDCVRRRKLKDSTEGRREAFECYGRAGKRKLLRNEMERRKQTR